MGAIILIALPLFVGGMLLILSGMATLGIGGTFIPNFELGFGLFSLGLFFLQVNWLISSPREEKPNQHRRLAPNYKKLITPLWAWQLLTFFWGMGLFVLGWYYILPEQSANLVESLSQGILQIAWLAVIASMIIGLFLGARENALTKKRKGL